jgi:DNA processing protein
VYPRRHVVLFERVRAAGVLLSETGFGIGANRFRFPVRNRIIAALAEILARECVAPRPADRRKTPGR